MSLVVLCLVAQSCLILYNTMDCSLPRNSPGKNTGVGCHALLQGIFSTQWSKPGQSLQVDSLLSEPPGKSKNTRVGSLSLLQGIFPTQRSNRGLLHCRWILYQLSYQESPQWVKEWSKTADLEKASLVPEESKETRQQLKRESGITVEVWAHL